MAVASVVEHQQSSSFIAELEQNHLHPLWDRYQRITPIKPQASDTPFLGVGAKSSRFSTVRWRSIHQ